MEENEIPPFETAQMNPEDILLSETSQVRKNKHLTIALIRGC